MTKPKTHNDLAMRASAEQALTGRGGVSAFYGATFADTLHAHADACAFNRLLTDLETYLARKPDDTVARMLAHARTLRADLRADLHSQVSATLDVLRERDAQNTTQTQTQTEQDTQ